MIGGDFDTPMVYQDLANSTMGPMAMPPLGGITGGYYNTSYLGGVKMQPQLDHDKISLINHKEKDDRSTMKKALAALGIIIAVGCIAPLRKSIKSAGGFGKYMKNQWTNIVNVFKGNNPPKVSWWQKVKNKFSRKPTP